MQNMINGTNIKASRISDGKLFLVECGTYCSLVLEIEQNEIKLWSLSCLTFDDNALNCIIQFLNSSPTTDPNCRQASACVHMQVAPDFVKN